MVELLLKLCIHDVDTLNSYMKKFDDKCNNFDKLKAFST